MLINSVRLIAEFFGVKSKNKSFGFFNWMQRDVLNDSMFDYGDHFVAGFNSYALSQVFWN